MSDQGATAFPSQSMVECGICSGNASVTWFCKYCRGSLCDLCKQRHQTTPLFRNHPVVPRTVEVVRLHGPAKIAEHCRFHPTKELSTYCEDCKVPCCVTCQTEKHQRHTTSPIEDRYLSAEKKLNDYAKYLEKEVKPMLVKFLQEIDENEIRIKDEISLFGDELKQTVDVACDQLVREVDKSYVNNCSNIKERLKSDKDMVDKLLNEVQLKIREGKLSIIDYFPPDPKSFIEDFASPTQNLPRFIPGKEIIDVIKSKTGRIETQNKIRKSKPGRRERSPIQPTQFVRVKNTLPPLKRIDQADINISVVKTFQTKMVASSLIAAGPQLSWFVNVDIDMIYQCNEKGEVIKSVPVKGCGGIKGLVIKGSGEMLVSCRDKKVRQIGGEVSVLIDTTPFYCEDMCLTEMSEIVVCMSGMDKSNHVAVYSPDGKHRKLEIRGGDGKGQHLITKPYRVVPLGRDLCVLNVSNVVCVDVVDFVKWVYDGKKAGQSRPFRPRGICVDKFQNLLVTDENNHCVHYLSRDGKLIGVILTQDQTKLSNLWGICVDDAKEQVWVGDSSRNVVIASYLK